MIWVLRGATPPWQNSAIGELKCQISGPFLVKMDISIWILDDVREHPLALENFAFGDPLFHAVFKF